MTMPLPAAVEPSPTHLKVTWLTFIISNITINSHQQVNGDQLSKYVTHIQPNSHVTVITRMHSQRTNLRRSGGSGFRTLDSRIRSVIRIATKIVSLGPWAMPYPSKKFRQNPFTSLLVIRRTDRQTDRQTDRTENITSFFGGGNNNQHDLYGSFIMASLCDSISGSSHECRLCDRWLRTIRQTNQLGLTVRRKTNTVHIHHYYLLLLRMNAGIHCWRPGIIIIRN